MTGLLTILSLGLQELELCLGQPVREANGLWKTLEIPEALWNELIARRVSMDRERHTGMTKMHVDGPSGSFSRNYFHSADCDDGVWPHGRSGNSSAARRRIRA